MFVNYYKHKTQALTYLNMSTDSCKVYKLVYVFHECILWTF